MLGDLLCISILSDLMLLGVGVRKTAVHKEFLILGMKFRTCAHSCRPLDGNKPFSKKNTKRDDN